MEKRVRCTKCKKYKKQKDFYKNRGQKSGYLPRCKECTKKDRKDFAKNNPNKVNEWSRNSYARNKHNWYDKRRIWLEDNKNNLNEYWKERKKKLRQEDAIFKFKYNTSTLVRNSFSKIKIVKNSKTTEILGCSIEEFKNHIESQFLNWMTWENYGNCESNTYNCSWHLDHIIPASIAKTKEEIIILNHWSNFQPKCGKSNIEKGNNLYICTNLIKNEINSIIEKYE